MFKMVGSPRLKSRALRGCLSCSCLDSVHDDHACHISGGCQSEPTFLSVLKDISNLTRGEPTKTYDGNI